MSKKLKFFAMMLTCILLSLSQAFGQVTITGAAYKGKGGASGTGGSATATVSGITITSTKAYYSSDSEIREYQNGTLTVSSSATMTQIVINCTGASRANFSTTTGTLTAKGSTPQTWTGSATSVTFTADAQSRWSSIVVTTSGGTTYTVSYAAGDGSGTNPGAHTGVSSGASITLKANTFTAPTGKQFAGWNDGSNTYAAGASYTVTGDKTMTAQWECIEPTISGQPASANYTVGDSPSGLSVTASLSSGTMTYLWKVSTNGGSTWSNASGTNNAATYAAANISTAATGTTKYKCIVTNSTASCSTESDVATITVSEPATPATVTLENYSGSDPTGLHVGDSYTLPSSNSFSCGTKTFVGWSTVEIDNSAGKPGSNYYEPGGSVTISSASMTIYAVFATGTPGTPTPHAGPSFSRSGSSNTVTSGYTFDATAQADNNGFYKDASNGVGYVRLRHTATNIFSSKPSRVVLSARIGGGSARNPLGNNVMAQLVDKSGNGLGNATTVTTKITTAGGDDYNIDLDLTDITSAAGVQLYHTKETGYNVRYYSFSLTYYTGGETTYSNYTTSCGAIDPTVTFSNGTYTIGGSALDLRTLWESNSSGAVTFSVTNANGTGATIAADGYSLSASTAGTCTVQASQAAASGFNAITATATITVQNPTCSTPTFDNGTNTYNNDVTVAISCASPSGTTIHYTTGASPADPTCSSGTTGSSVTISATGTVLKAVACKDGYNVSSVASATYTLKCATPTFSVAAGTYTSTQSVELSCITTDAVIHYTVDGSTPTAGSPTYSSAITVDDDMTIKAIAVKANYVTSDEASAAYSIKDCTWYESFDTNSGDGGNNGKWSGISSFSSPTFDNGGWTVTSGGAGVQCIKSGTNGTQGSATTPAITVDNGATGKVKFRMGPWNSSSTVAQVVFTGAEVSTGVSTWNAGSAMTNGEWNDYTVNFTTTSTSLTIQFTRSAGDNRFWLDEVCVKMDPAAYTVTFDANGHGTAPDPITDVTKGSKISKPTPDPSATGWTFGGWYKEPACTNAWTWATDQVTSNTTLYAKWTCSNPTSLSISETNSKGDFCPGESMTLTVSGSNIGTGATYQWKKGGSPISGATSASYTKTLTRDDAGTYTCDVSNGSCTATSSGYDVKVWTFYHNASGSFAHGNLTYSSAGKGTITIELAAGETYEFKVNNNMSSGNWFGNTGTMTATIAEGDAWTFGSAIASNCHITAGIGGNYVFKVNYSDSGNPKVSVTYPTANQAANYDIWFDKSVVDGWNVAQTSDLFLRIGKSADGGNNKNNTTDGVSWSLVPGTDRFYTIKTLAYTGFEAWHISNNTSWAGNGNSIYMVNGSGYAITKATDFQKYVVGSTGVTIVPTSSHNTESGCNYWYVSKTDGMLTHTATITTPTNGTITIANAAQSLEATTTTSDLPHRTILTVTATPAPGYQLSSLTVNGNAFTSGNEHILSADATIAATFTAKTITITWDGNGGNTPSPTESSYTYDGSTVALATVTHATKVFAGWWTDPSAGTQITEIGTTNKPSSDVTYYAHWSDGNTVYFHPGVGSVAIDHLTQTTLGGAVDAFPTPTIDCEGWSFAGWNEGSALAETTTNPESGLYAGGHTGYVPATATVNMYAVWKKNFGGGTGTVTNTFDWEAANSAWSKSSMSNPQSYSDYKHGGSYSGNVTAGGAYIYYLTKLESPLSIDFYYTKTTNNTTSGNYWCVQTSSNGSTWTTRETSLGNNSLTKGTYEQETVDLSSYSNVYVRLLWSNADNSAGGNLDDVTISYTGDIADQWKWTSSADDYGCTPANQVKTPVISPNTEAQTGDVSVTITCATADATIRYTTDGTDPTSSSGTIYNGAFTVSCSATVKAIAYKATMDDSNVASQAYTITVPTPTFSLAGGTYYDANQTVTLSLPTAHTGTVIKYTTNGDDPTSASATYSSAITVTEGTTTIKAIGYNSTCSTSSSVASATYIVRFGTVYTLVTDANDLMAGDKIVIISSNSTTETKKALSTKQNTNNRDATNDYNINNALTVAKIYPAVNEGTTVDAFTLVGEPGSWGLKGLNNKYLGVGDTEDSRLRSYDESYHASNTYATKWSISITSDIATIANIKYTSKDIQLNNTIFAAYGNGNQTSVKIYSLPNPTPVIKVEGTFSAFSTCYGTASSAQTIYVSGRSLTDNMVISGPAGYEFSSDGSSYSTTLTLAPSTRTVARQLVYVRLSATATGGAHNGNVNVAVSADSQSQDVAVTGSVNTADIYIDRVHGNSITPLCGSYSAPSCTDESPNTGSCTATHYKFMGWVTAANIESGLANDDAYKAVIVAAGTAMTASGTTYYAVWAEEE